MILFSYSFISPFISSSWNISLKIPFKVDIVCTDSASSAAHSLQQPINKLHSLREEQVLAAAARLSERK